MRILALLVLALGSMTATAQLYSWKDADGKVHYSDQPPAEKTPVRKLTAPPPPANPPAAAAKAGGEKDAKKADEAAKGDKDKVAANPEKEKADAEQRRANCEKARGTLQALESGSIRFGVTPKGERVALEGAVLQAELENARKAVEGWCK